MSSFLHFLGLGKKKSEKRPIKNSKDFASDAYRKALQAKLYELIINDKKHRDWIMSKFNPFRIKAGDVVILNKYNLLYSSENGWDGGSKSLLNLIKGQESIDVVYATVNDVVLATLLFTDRVYAFIDNHSDEALNQFETNNRLVREFNLWCCDKDDRNNVNATWRNSDGLYVDIMFTLHNITSISPKWGLNAYSFIPLESQLGKKTESFWLRESELTKKLHETISEKKVLERNITNLYNEILYNEINNGQR